jgi:hypothetical protein
VNGLINLSAPFTEFVNTSPIVDITEKEPRSLIELVIVAFDAIVTLSYFAANLTNGSAYATRLRSFAN